ncbi:PIN domain-containing protein [Roseofilum reptotaenium CS-1145]|uniref:DNA-binding protein n=1 Tax=Roseofilum reptotaenium AO1-A TaxID=1925591 RepID=A0A1L9QQG2_9CYAN|nr:PIN domain-containing protein [Roseofilum reptotaenium]MDB9516597.1 PIN domain-containing protein [Roseofilum reptotaenium CS-1145]OJJ24883.1 DNA-binding protein [Roseofilum reptotaenium AO1-A]
MKFLIDTNIVLDFLLQREPFYQDAERLFQAIHDNKIIGYVTATTLTNIFYIARRHTASIDKAQQAVVATLDIMVICPVNRETLESALTVGCTDFEDAVQVACAMDRGLDGVVTRDTGFPNVLIPILSVAEALQQLENGP